MLRLDNLISIKLNNQARFSIRDGEVMGKFSALCQVTYIQDQSAIRIP